MQTDEQASIPLDFTAAREPVSEAARAVILAAETQKKKGVVGIKGLQIGKSDTYDVCPFDIKIKPGWNTRDFSTPENQAHVLALAASIAARGVEQPLTAYTEGGVLYLSDGESRLRATLHAINVLGAEILKVPVRMEARGSNDADRVAGQLVRNSGKPLTQLEKAEVVRRLLAYKWNVDKIAEHVGVTPANVRQLIDVLELPEEMRQHVQQGTVAAAEAVKVTREHGAAAPALVEAAAAHTSANGGKRAGRATPAALRAVQSARDDVPKPLTLPALLSILKAAEATEELTGAVSVILSGEDWDRISAAF